MYFWGNNYNKMTQDLVMRWPDLTWPDRVQRQKSDQVTVRVRSKGIISPKCESQESFSSVSLNNFKESVICKYCLHLSKIIYNYILVFVNNWNIFLRTIGSPLNVAHPTPQDLDFNEFEYTLSEVASTKVTAFLSKWFFRR